MATNRIYADIETERRTATVGNDVAPGTPLMIGGRPVVTLTGSGDHVNTVTIDLGGGRTVTSAAPGGGIGLLDDEATVTPTGTWAFDVAGADADTERGSAVYLAADGTLTLDGGVDPDTNAKFGIVEFFRGELSATDTAVTIGVNLG